MSKSSSAALAALGSSNSKGERTLSASARNNEDQLLSKGERVKDSKGIEASGGENNGFGTREAHLVRSPLEDRHLSKGDMGDGEGGEEGGASSGTRMKPAASVVATLFNEESLRLVFRMT